MSQAAWGRVLRRLVEQGLLEGPAVFAGRVTVDHASRSNHVAIIRLDQRPILVLKRCQIALDHLNPSEAEVTANQWLASHSATARLAPRLLFTDDNVMAFEPVADAQSFGDALAESYCEPTVLLSALGRQIGRLHARPDCTSLPNRRPWVLGVVHGVVPDMLMPDPEIAAMVQEIGDSPSLRAALEEFEHGWLPLVPCHGDVKFDNIVLGTIGSSSRRRLWLLDWELAGLGLPAWDLAGVADGLIVPALMSRNASGALQQAAHAQPAIAAHRAIVGAELSPDPRQLTLATVARLVQSALQLCAMRFTVDESVIAARHVLRGAEALSLELTASRNSLISCVA